MPDRRGSDWTSHTWRVFGQIIACNQTWCEGVWPAQSFLTSQGGKKKNDDGWSDTVSRRSILPRSNCHSQTVLQFISPCASIYPVWTATGGGSSAAFITPLPPIEVTWDYFFFRCVGLLVLFLFSLPSGRCLLPQPPSHPPSHAKSYYCVLEPTSAPGVYFSRRSWFCFFNLSYFFHTCSIIATIWTKRALQRCNKKKQGNEYFYIVDTWLNICFFSH